MGNTDFANMPRRSILEVSAGELHKHTSVVDVVFNNQF